MNSKGLTIVELVVVLAIIAVVVAISLPATHQLRESARELVCRNNVKQINLALSQYSELTGIPAFNHEATISGWTIDILPFIEQKNLMSNLPIGELPEKLPPKYFQPPSVFRCPNQSASRDDSLDSIASAHYVLVAKPTEERGFFSITEAPRSLTKPWVISPEIQSTDEIREGHHRGGFFYASGFDYGVQFRRRD